MFTDAIKLMFMAASWCVRGWKACNIQFWHRQNAAWVVMVTNYVYVTYGRHAVHKQTLKNHAVLTDLLSSPAARHEALFTAIVERRAIDIMFYRAHDVVFVHNAFIALRSIYRALSPKFPGRSLKQLMRLLNDTTMRYADKLTNSHAASYHIHRGRCWSVGAIVVKKTFILKLKTSKRVKSDKYI